MYIKKLTRHTCILYLILSMTILMQTFVIICINLYDNYTQFYNTLSNYCYINSEFLFFNKFFKFYKNNFQIPWSILIVQVVDMSLVTETYITYLRNQIYLILFYIRCRLRKNTYSSL